MNTNEISYCLFTSTRGHFNIKTRYKQTVDSMLTQVPANIWSKLIAHVKISPGEDNIFNEMKEFLETKGFEVIGTVGEWRHGNDGKDNSHQVQYILDQNKILSLIKTSYFFFSEDDWVCNVKNKELSYWLNFSQKLLLDNPDLMQVRIPRFGNEFERINQLLRKHNIHTRAIHVDENYFVSGDWSNNLYLARTRDLRATLKLVINGSLPMHSETGTGIGMRFLSGIELPLAVLSPKNIYCSHIGTRKNEEDDFNNPAMETLLT